MPSILPDTCLQPSREIRLPHVRHQIPVILYLQHLLCIRLNPHSCCSLLVCSAYIRGKYSTVQRTSFSDGARTVHIAKRPTSRGFKRITRASGSVMRCADCGTYMYVYAFRYRGVDHSIDTKPKNDRAYEFPWKYTTSTAAGALSALCLGARMITQSLQCYCCSNAG